MVEVLLQKINHQSSTRTVFLFERRNFMINEKILKENDKLDTQIHTLQSQLKTLPEGKLICASNGKWQKWYRSTNHGTTYLPKKERQLAERLAYKKYLLLQLENLLQEKEAITLYLNHHDSNLQQKEDELFYSPKFHDLIKPHFGIFGKFCQIEIRSTY